MKWILVGGSVAFLAFLLWWGALNWARLGCGPYDDIGIRCRERVMQMFTFQRP